MMKIGLVGAGFMGGMHMACYEALSHMDVKITAVADVREEKAKAVAEKTGATIYETGLDLIKNADVDIIDICLPTHLHTQHAVAAMKKGRAVFLEKPVCGSKEDAELLLKMQQETNAKVMVGQCIRSWSEYKWLKEAIDNNTYGKVLSGVFTRLSCKPNWSWNNWLNTIEQGGTVALDMHVHDVDYIRYIMGEPDEVKAVAARDSEGVIQQIFATYQYGSAAVVAEACWDYPDKFPFTMAYRVKMEKATAVFDSNSIPSLMIYPVDGESFAAPLEKEFEAENDIGGNLSSLGGYYNELEYFIRKLKNNEALEIAPLSEGVKSAMLSLKEIELSGGAKK